MLEPFTMPIINTRLSVTWRPTAQDRERAVFNHDQTLEQLKARCGVDWTELDAIVANEPWEHHKRTEDTSRMRVHRILSQRAELA